MKRLLTTHVHTLYIVIEVHLFSFHFRICLHLHNRTITDYETIPTYIHVCSFCRLSPFELPTYREWIHFSHNRGTASLNITVSLSRFESILKLLSISLLELPFCLLCTYIYYEHHLILSASTLSSRLFGTTYCATCGCTLDFSRNLSYSTLSCLFTFEAAKLLTTSTNVVEWCKSNAHTLFLPEVICVCTNSTRMRYSSNLP